MKNTSLHSAGQAQPPKGRARSHPATGGRARKAANHSPSQRIAAEEKSPEAISHVQHAGYAAIHKTRNVQKMIDRAEKIDQETMDKIYKSNGDSFQGLSTPDFLEQLCLSNF